MNIIFNNNGDEDNRGEVPLPTVRYDMLVTAIKANQNCKAERQNLSVLRFNPIGKYIEPELAKEAGISLVDCFQRM